jgi:hypothetical protein
MVVAGRVTDDGAANDEVIPPVIVFPLLSVPVTVFPELLVIDSTERLTSPVKVPVGETVTTSVCGALPAAKVR